VFKRIIRRITPPFSELYDEKRLLPDIRRSLHAIIFANIFGNICGIVTTGPALTGYAGALGASELAFGVLSSIPSALTVLQIPFAALVSRTQRRKRYLLTYGLIARCMWIAAGLVPFVMPMAPSALKLWTVIFLAGITACGGSLINVCWFPWLADLLPIEIRGRWFSLRDTINSFTGVLFGLLIARLLDAVPGYAGYCAAFLIGGAFGVFDMVCFSFVKEVYSQPPVRVNTAGVFRRILGDKPFTRLIVFWTLWCFTANLSGPYLTRYALSEMGLTFVQLTVCSQIASALTASLVVSRWGRLLDRYGAKPVLWVSCIVAALTPAFYCFSAPGSVMPTLLHNVIGAAFWSASNLAVTNLQLNRSPDDMRPSYIAVFSCVCNLAGTFLGTMAGGALIEGLRASQQLFDPYKVTFLISVVTRLGIVLLIIPGMENEKGYTASQMVRRTLRQLRLPPLRVFRRRPAAGKKKEEKGRKKI